MLAHVFCASTFGVDAHLIDVELNYIGGMPNYYLVGLPDKAIVESRSRIIPAIKNSNATMPYGTVTVNLAPADLPKEGSAFDLPIAVCLLVVSRQVKNDKLQDTVILGELALDGSLRPVKGVLPIVIEAKERGLKNVICPLQNGPEAAVVEGIQVYGLENLGQVIGWLNDTDTFDAVEVDLVNLFRHEQAHEIIDYSDVKGQENVKRSMEVGAAGGHNIIMVGPPGSGKTMIARRLSSILPPLSLGEALETTKIHSVAGLLTGGKALIAKRPFRSPHHTISDVALVGGGSMPMPGEISLAHNGVLFLDELPEFKRSALEVLRQPLEDGHVSISRARMSVNYPSNIMLVASMNPSPTGDWYDPADPNGSAPAQMQRYLSKISGPLLDRIDLHVEVNKVSFDELSGKGEGEGSALIRKRVVDARLIQHARFLKIENVYCNAQMSTRLVRKICRIDHAGSALLKKAITALNLSARAYDRILKVSRTIADLECSDGIKTIHLAEAIQYRSLDREGWLG
ncbi:MAG: YifB family Mg chelatase-like AAA ATPase [Balneolales bacterium]